MPSDEWVEQTARDHICGGNEPQTIYEIGAVKNISALLLATVRKALRAERLAEVEARGAHLAEFHPDGERAELSNERICGILVSHGCGPTISAVAAVRDVIAESRATEILFSSSGWNEWNDVVKALSGLHEVYFSEWLDGEVLDAALKDLMGAYVAWLD